MSATEARRFIQAGQTQKALRDAVSARIAALTEEQEMIRAVVEVAAANGFEFSAEEYQAAAREMSRQLSDTELGKIAAGIDQVAVVVGQELSHVIVF